MSSASTASAPSISTADTALLPAGSLAHAITKNAHPHAAGHSIAARAADESQGRSTTEACAARVPGSGRASKGRAMRRGLFLAVPLALVACRDRLPRPPEGPPPQADEFE